MAAAAAMRRLELRTVSTHDTGLWEVWFTGELTALPESGSIVVLGWTAKDAPQVLYQFRLEGGRLQKVREVKGPCEHEYSYGVLGVMVEGQELLALACKGCRDIKLMNLETGEAHVAYSSEKRPHTQCHGEAGRMWVYCKGDDRVRELNCSSKAFTETGRTVNIFAFPWYMCYLPAPHRALVLSHYQRMEAVSCETGQQLWRLDEIDGRLVDGRPLGGEMVLFHPHFSLVIMSDLQNDRLLLLDAASGELLQSIATPQKCTWSLGHYLLMYNITSLTICQLVDPVEGWFSAPHLFSDFLIWCFSFHNTLLASLSLSLAYQEIQPIENTPESSGNRFCFEPDRQLFSNQFSEKQLRVIDWSCLEFENISICLCWCYFEKGSPKRQDSHAWHRGRLSQTENRVLKIVLAQLSLRGSLGRFSKSAVFFMKFAFAMENKMVNKLLHCCIQRTSLTC